MRFFFKDLHPNSCNWMDIYKSPKIIFSYFFCQKKLEFSSFIFLFHLRSRSFNIKPQMHVSYNLAHWFCWHVFASPSIPAVFLEHLNDYALYFVTIQKFTSKTYMRCEYIWFMASSRKKKFKINNLIKKIVKKLC